MVQFEDLVGKTFGFYGVDNNDFKLGRKVWRAEEDESDGLRSYLGSIEVIDSDGIFFKRPLGKVRVEQTDDGYYDGFNLVDVKDGHVWLRVGTNNADDYYPCFVFDYEPRPPK